MNEDRFGMQFTTGSLSAAAAYLDALDRMLAADAGAVEALHVALRQDPEFALAHAALGRCHQVAGRSDAARSSMATAMATAERLSTRERSHVHTMAAVVNGDTTAFAQVRAHIDSFPRDALILAPGIAVFGLIGFSGRKNRNEEVLDWMKVLAPDYQHDWWFAAWYGFMHTETGDYARGQRLVKDAYARNPRNANAAHALAHCTYECDQGEDGAAFLRDWLPRYHPEAPLHCHLSWHLALFELENGHAAKAWTIFENSISPAAKTLAPPINILTDSAAFLWRAALMREAVRTEQWETVTRYAAQKFPTSGLDFVDVHAVMALVGAGKTEALQETLQRLRLNPGLGDGLSHALGVALLAYSHQDWKTVIATLQACSDELVRLGGSGAQRDVIEHTMLSALLRSGQTDQARTWLSQRRMRPRNQTDRVLRFLAPD
ncbi:MAG: tetratricopeptide repeat protein [Deltaproteobacteria bacterium]|nr:tetratricopeptide repeat protein [Deltaproteobacteria bacterium]